MEVQYFKRYGYNLNRDMELKYMVMQVDQFYIFLVKIGRFFDFENFKMTDTWAPWIESGQVMVFP